MKETPEEQYNAFWKEIIEDDESRLNMINTRSCQ